MIGEGMVSIVILTYNRLDVTQQCLISIERHTALPHEVIVVDNGSSDGTVEWLRQLAADKPHYLLVDNGQNLGFAKGCNQGIELARGEYILLLNNDTVVTPDWLSGMLECFDDEQTGIVGPMTNNISGIQQWPGCSYGLSELNEFASQFRSQHRYQRVPQRRVVGFCMLFRRSLVEQIGGLDEQFGSGNYEDDDFCLRAALEGFQNVIAADVFIHHVGSVSFEANRINYQEALLKNHQLFTRKWSSPVADERQARKIIITRTLEEAESLKQRGYLDKATDLILHKGIAQIPDETKWYQFLAAIFRDTGMYADAVAVLRESPDSGDPAWLNKRAYQLAVCYYQLGDMVQAEEAQKQIHSPRSRALLGSMLLQRQGKSCEAQQIILEQLRKQPGDAESLEQLALLLEEAGDRQRAFDCFEQATRLAPLSAAVERYVGLATELGHAERAISLLGECRHFYPQDSRLAFQLISCLLSLGREGDALEIIQQAMLQFNLPQGFYEAALQVRRVVGPRQVNPARKLAGVSVSLCMIVKNEEQNLPRCLASVLPVVDELVIVDTGSSDRTRQVAELYGAKVVECAWNGDFSAARNYSLDQAEGNWILVMDADEVVSARDYAVLLEMITGNAGKAVAFTITTRNYTNKVDVENWQANCGEYPKEEAGRGWMPSDKVRLFPNRPDIRFENPIHEMVEAALARAGVLDVKSSLIVHHYGYLDKARQLQKKEAYYELGKKKLLESGGSPTAICELAIQAGGIGRYDEAIELWQQALGYDQDSYLAWFNLGYCYLSIGRFEEGSQASLRAMQLREQYREALINYALCELCLGRGATVLPQIEQAQQQHTDYPTFLLMSAVLYASLGHQESGVEKFKELAGQQVEFSGFISNVLEKLRRAGHNLLAQQLKSTAQMAGVELTVRPREEQQ